jgi:hypothetical protein
MSDDSVAEIFRIFSDTWQESMDRKDYHDAIATGIAAYLIVREKKNEQIAKGTLNLIHVAITSLLHADGLASGDTSCSFCGRSGSDVRLGAGPNAFICSDCVTTFNEVLNTTDHS